MELPRYVFIRDGLDQNKIYMECKVDIIIRQYMTWKRNKGTLQESKH